MILKSYVLHQGWRHVLAGIYPMCNAYTWTITKALQDTTTQEKNTIK